MIAADLTSLAFAIDQLQLLPGNPRRGDIEAVKRSLDAFGQRKPIVVRRSDNVVIAGNHTLQAAQALGWDEIAVVWVDDDDVTSKAFALADNRTAELGDYDEEALADLINDVGSLNPGLLESSGWDDKAVQELLDRVEQIELPTDVDDVPEDVPAVSKLGDVWLLGKHRVMCGDSTNPTDVEKLMAGAKADMAFTDPPYGVNYEGIKNDDRNGLEELLRGAFDNFRANSKSGASIYVFHSDRCADIFHKVFREFFHFSSMIIWVKNSITLSQTDYQSQHEPCLYGWMDNGTHFWNADRKQTSVWNFDKERVEGHTTPKPVELVVKAVANSSKKGHLILDLFGGSGSTLIAAEETNRLAYLMELDPHYVDVICARFQKLTGVLPVLESSGKVHDFLNV